MKKLSLWILAFFIFWVGLAIVFASTDLPISHAFFNPESGWSIFFENYGQVPGTLVAILGMNVLLRLQNGKTFKSILAMLGLGLFILLSGFMVGGDLQGQQSGLETSKTVSLFIGVVLFTGLQVWFRLTPEAKIRRFEQPALVAVLLVLFSGILTTWLFKILWGRWTFRDILAVGNLDLYTPWFLPQGPNGHNSFPSGHTNFALTVLPLLLLIPKHSKWNSLAWIMAILWGAINAASRVVIGAHFASDVLFGGCQTILWFWILSRRIVKE